MLNENILNKKHTYVLGISGGSDSMFLLENMHFLGYKIIVAHVNYQKRPESQKDEDLVRKYCQKFNLLFYSYQVNPEEYTAVKNFQAWAREKRYNFFKKIAQENHVRCVVLAHHLDDHLETYCFQKKRNSLVEHWGLAAKIRWKNIWLCRPLLSYNKEQICQYLKKKNIPYAIDQTNFSSLYLRNNIRQQLTNLTSFKKSQLLNEAIDKNQKLSQNKLILKELIRKTINNASNLNLLIWRSSSFELKLRLIYYWVNKNTNKGFVSQKKSIWNEIEKQLVSPKKRLAIILNKNYQIKKNFPWAILEKIFI